MSKCIKVEALGIGYANPDVFENKAYAEGWNSAVKIIKEAEIIDAEPVRHGHWIEHDEDIWSNEAECSECHKRIGHSGLPDRFLREFKYCHNCGAKMDKENGE